MIDVTKMCGDSKGSRFRVYQDWCFVRECAKAEDARIYAQVLAEQSDQQVRYGPGVR